MTALDDAILTAQLETEAFMGRVASSTGTGTGAQKSIENFGGNLATILWTALRWVAVVVGVVLAIIGTIKVFKYVRGRKDPEHAQEKGSLVSIILIYVVAAIFIVGGTVAFGAILRGIGDASQGIASDGGANNWKNAFKQ